MRRETHFSGCARCGAGAGCSTIKYQSRQVRQPRRRAAPPPRPPSPPESGPLRAVHLSRHKWPGGVVNFRTHLLRRRRAVGHAHSAPARLEVHAEGLAHLQGGAEGVYFPWREAGPPNHHDDKSGFGPVGCQ